MDTIDPFTQHLPTPTANRPLLGLTVLVIEDSRFACEAMRLLCLRSGARIRRADCLRSARRHLQVYRPTIAIIDIGLPDGNGLDLIEELAAATPRPEALIGMSGDENAGAAALQAGAAAFLTKPVMSLATFQETVLNCLPKERRPSGPRALPKEFISPDPIAFQDDMAHAVEILDANHDGRTLDYVAQFLQGVARSAKDGTLERAAVNLATRRAEGASATSEAATLAGIVHQRLTGRIAI